MSAGQDDIDLETLDEGMGDSVEDTNVVLEDEVVVLSDTVL